jgi:hypothetical protein
VPRPQQRRPPLLGEAVEQRRERLRPLAPAVGVPAPRRPPEQASAPAVVHRPQRLLHLRRAASRPGSASPGAPDAATAASASAA